MSGPCRGYLERLKATARILGVSLESAADHMDGTIRVHEAIQATETAAPETKTGARSEPPLALGPKGPQ